MKSMKTLVHPPRRRGRHSTSVNKQLDSQPTPSQTVPDPSSQPTVTLWNQEEAHWTEVRKTVVNHSLDRIRKMNHRPKSLSFLLIVPENGSGHSVCYSEMTQDDQFRSTFTSPCSDRERTVRASVHVLQLSY